MPALGAGKTQPATTDIVARIRDDMARRGVLHLADRLVSIERLDYVSAWRQELRDGRHGQRADAPGRWVLDGLWSAACFQVAAEALERLISETANFKPDASLLERLIDDFEEAWAEAHRSMIANAPKLMREARHAA